MVNGGFAKDGGGGGWFIGIDSLHRQSIFQGSSLLWFCVSLFMNTHESHDWMAVLGRQRSSCLPMGESRGGREVDESVF